jgi:hypothetical protein
MGVMRAAALALLMVAAFTVGAGAQAPAPDAGPDGPSAGASAQATGEAPVDTTKLGVSLTRIKKGLRLSETREQVSGTPLKLEYQIQVYGAAPRLDFLKDFNIAPGAPVSYGAPTHSEFLNHWTPQAYRAPPANLGALAGWALFQVAKRSEKSKCEQEIADYRALVMQGISAPAPRCSQ